MSNGTNDLKYLEKKWSDETGGTSYFQDLNFPADREWVKIDIIIEGHKNKVTGCHTEVQVNSQKRPDSDHWNVIHGTDSRYYSYNLSAISSSLAVTGYITNHSVFTGGGADITVRAYYI